MGNRNNGKFADHAWVEHIDQLGQTWIIDSTESTVINFAENLDKTYIYNPITGTIMTVYPYKHAKPCRPKNLFT